MMPTAFELARQGPYLPGPTILQRHKIDLAMRISRAAPASSLRRRLGDDINQLQVSITIKLSTLAVKV